MYGATTMKSSGSSDALAVLVDVRRPEQPLDLVAHERRLLRRRLRGAPRARPAGSGSRCPSATDRARADLRRLEPALVERLRDEGVHLRPHPPRLLEEEPHPRPHRLVVAEQVREHRRVRSRAGACPARPAGAGSGRRAGRGSAPPSRPRARRRARTARPRRRTACPRAGRAPRARRGTTCRRAAGARRRASPRCSSVLSTRPRPSKREPSLPPHFLQPRERVALLDRRLLDVLEELVDRLVAERGHADALAGLHQRDRHPRAVPRLARAGRALDEQVAAVEAERGLGERPVEARARRPPLENRRRAPGSRAWLFAKRRTASRCTQVGSGCGGISASRQRLVRALRRRAGA